MNYAGLEASAKTIRCLAIDAIEKAKSGHPGLPLGCADIGAYLWGEVMHHNPEELSWLNRDRFVLSAGHGSMLLYSLMHLAGYGVTLDDIKSFRQFKSNTPGHPEYGWTPGVETSTGPLGQGLGNAVGMALAGKRHSAKYNREGFPIMTSRIFCLVGDGDLMEGLSYEVCSLAGHLKLNNLILIYDSNKISIEGSTDICFTENIRGRFESQNWAVLESEAHDFDSLKNAFDQAENVRLQENKPVIIIMNTIIGKGAPQKQGTNKCHGAPLGAEEAAAAKEAMGVTSDFYVDPEAVAYFDDRRKVWKAEHEEWKKLFAAWGKAYPELKEDWEKTFRRQIPDSCFKNLPSFEVGDSIATRNAANTVLNAILKDVEYVVSGSADLGSSTMTMIKDNSVISSENYLGYNVQYGIREHAMGTMINGMYLFGGILPICGTFLAFSTYMTPSIRMAALMRIPSIFLFSHDSIFVGEDGPTHHPVEHLTNLRLMPNVNVMRPADPEETKIAWEIALKSKTSPSVIITTRQKVPVIDYSKYESCKNAEHGAYIIKKEKHKNIDLIIMATGSEVFPSLQVAELLEKEGYSVRVVNFFSSMLYERQSEEYKESVLPSSIKKRLMVEAGMSTYWYKYIGFEGDHVSVDRFGISAKAEDLAKVFGINKENIFQKAKDLIKA